MKMYEYNYEYPNTVSTMNVTFLESLGVILFLNLNGVRCMEPILAIIYDRGV